MQNGEDAAGSKWPAAFSESSQRKIIWLFCLLAAIHIFVFSAAFPFFNNVDEPMHFDLVVKYSHGHLPTGKEFISPDAATYLALFASCAYFGTPNEFPGGKMPSPPWTEPVQKMQQDLAANSAGWRNVENYEVSQTPLYYALTGLAWHTGQRLHMDGGHLLYGLRFLNIVPVVALVWLAYFTLKTIFPENFFMQTGVPALLAFMPQTAFYSIGNDLLPALCFGLAFVWLLKWLSAENPSPWLGALTGLAFAATYLSKMTNLPLLAVAALAVLIKTGQSLRRENWHAAFPPLSAFLLCAVPPVAGWIIWCKCNYGDLTGSIVKTQILGWTVKPFGQWWHHPIYTPNGMWTYLSGNLGTFWQGEFKWHNQPLLLPGTDVVYTLLSLALLVAALPGLYPRFSRATPLQRQALWLSLGCFAGGLVFFALMSTVYDFDDCPYPSRWHPYFTSGRLLLGAVIPFLLLIVYGLDRALNRFGNRAKFFTLAAMVLGMLAVEIATDWPVFPNGYNWFHLP